MSYYTLKWCEYASTIASSLTDAFNKKEFCDATIVCNGKHYAVHRLILSLGSNFFRNIFAKISSTEQLVIIDGIENSHLEKIILFMYSGIVYVQDDDVASFLKAAQSLHIKGLSDNTKCNSSSITSKDSSETYSLQLRFEDEMCDFPGFSSTKEQFDSLSILKNKLQTIKDSEEKYKVNFLSSDSKVNTRRSSMGYYHKVTTVVGDFCENDLKCISEKNLDKHLLQPIDYFNEKCDSNVVNKNKDIVTPCSNIISKANPFVPLERLTDSFINAANEGYKIQFKNKCNLDHNYYKNELKESKIEATKFDNGLQLFTPMETEISDTLEAVKDIENLKENISTSLRRLKHCAYCQFKTKSRITMNKHLRSHEVTGISSVMKRNYVSNNLSKAKIFSCSICSFKSKSKMAVNDHQYLKHPDQKVLTCKACSFKCEVPSIMTRHLFLHEKKKTFKCSLCSFSSMRQSEVISHRKQCNLGSRVNHKHSASTFMWEIDHGTSNCSSSSSVIIDDNEKLSGDFKNYAYFKCQYCSYTSTSKFAIEGHEAYHSIEEEPFKCSICPYRSAIKALVKCHEMTHVAKHR